MGLGTLLREGVKVGKAVLKDGQEIDLHTTQTGKFITVDARVGDESIGNATASVEDMIPDVFVSEPFRRRGLATAMFQEAHAHGAKLPNLNETRGQSPDGHALRIGVKAKVAAGALALAGAETAMAQEDGETHEEQPRTASPEALGDEESSRGYVGSPSAESVSGRPVGASTGLRGMLSLSARSRATRSGLMELNERLTGRPAGQGQAVSRTRLALETMNAELMGEELQPLPETAKKLFVPFQGQMGRKTQETNMAGKGTARGIRNNNPGNIDFNPKNKWQGQLEHDEKVESRFARFDSPQNGIRAMAKLLSNYQNKSGIRTIDGIINKWAPSVENDSDAYIAQVSKAVGVQPNDIINLKDETVLFKLVKAIIKHENGSLPYDDNVILEGVRAIN